MSNVIHSTVGIILMVFLAIVAHADPCRAVTNHYSRKPYSELRRKSMTTSSDDQANDPTALFQQLNSFRAKERINFLGASRRNNFRKNVFAQTAKRLQSAKAKDKLIHWLNKNSGMKMGHQSQHEEDPPSTREETDPQLDQQQQRIDRIQNDAADEKFASLLSASRRPSKYKPARYDYAEPSEMDGEQSPYLEANAYCKAPKTKAKFKIPTVTRTTPKTTATPTKALTECTSTECPVQEHPTCPAQKKRPTAIERLLQITQIMRKRASLIIKTVNLLDAEILKKYPSRTHRVSSHVDSATTSTSPSPRPSPSPLPTTSISPSPTTTPLPSPSPTTTTTPTATVTLSPCTKQPQTTNNQEAKSDRENSSNMETSKTKERLEKPKADLHHNKSFYFGFLPPEMDNTKEALALAMKEEQKLEQKVREEHQTQREIIKFKTRLQQQRRLRARSEPAPSAAARLELVLTTPSPMEKIYNYNTGKVLLKPHTVKIPEKPDKVAKQTQMLMQKNWKHGRRNKKKRNRNDMCMDVSENTSATSRRTVLRESRGPFMQRGLRFKRDRIRLHSNNPQFKSK